MSKVNDNEFFKNMVDELVEFGEFDPELAEGLRWLDKTDKYGVGISFYEKVFHCLTQYDINQKAKDWIDKRNAN